MAIGDPFPGPKSITIKIILIIPLPSYTSDLPANLILRICTKTRDGERPSQEWRRTCGRPSATWVHQICRDTGVTATEALLLAEDRPSGDRRETAADRFASWWCGWWWWYLCPTSCGRGHYVLFCLCVCLSFVPSMCACVRASRTLFTWYLGKF